MKANIPVERTTALKNLQSLCTWKGKRESSYSTTMQTTNVEKKLQTVNWCREMLTFEKVAIGLDLSHSPPRQNPSQQLN